MTSKVLVLEIEGKGENKQFFFAKKNQKTFLNQVRGCRNGGGTLGAWQQFFAGGWGGQRRCHTTGLG
jgi:hypothetical protein